MCTLIIMRHVFPDHPLVVASNRDERAGRASDPAAWHEEGGKRIYAPKDLVRGGHGSVFPNVDCLRPSPIATRHRINQVVLREADS